ncbi:MAG: MlaD family protein [Myxococcaceae bacterium]
MDERRLEMRVGVLVLTAVGGLLAMLWLMGELTLGRGAKLAVEFSHSGNVVAGAPVKLAGVVVGRVERVELTPEGRDAQGNPLPVRMRLSMQESTHAALREDALVTVATQGLLGEPYLELNAGIAQAPLTAEVVRGMDAARLEMVIARVSGFLDGASRILDQNPQVVGDLLGGVAGLTHTVDGVVTENRAEIRGLLVDAAAAVKEMRSVAELARGQLSPGGKAAQLVDDAAASAKTLRADLPALSGDARKALAGAAAVTGQMTPEDGQRLRVALAKYSAAGEKLERIAARAETVLARIEAGEGTIGGAYKDPQVYDDLRSLLSDLKRHPWKILWKD